MGYPVDNLVLGANEVVDSIRFVVFEVSRMTDKLNCIVYRVNGVVLPLMIDCFLSNLVAMQVENFPSVAPIFWRMKMVTFVDSVKKV